MCAICFLVCMQGEQCNAVPDTVDDIVADFEQEEKTKGVVYAYAKHTHTYTHLSPDKLHICGQVDLKEKIHRIKSYDGDIHY